MMNPVPWLQMTNMISYQGLVRTFPSSGIAGMLAPGRTIGQNVGISMGSAFFTDGPNTGSIGGAAIGAWFGGKFGEFAPFPGEVNDLIGGIGGEVIGNKIKDKVSESEK
ncbi:MULTISPECIES: hypothetical protein [unclassified Klebsiella]|uniref:hypothetical protein n=1 Tax=unclassified Klebsiella TaxID=2608929 RepID=UPI001D0FE460|nr:MULTISPECIES: hypothetical protein [unclassified Klebsiella]